MTSLFAPSASISKSLKRAAQGNAGPEASPVEAEVLGITSGGKRSRNGPNEGAVETELPETFAETGLKDWLCTVCRQMGFRKPTPIQQHCIPAVMRKRDVMGCAETGSGKTAAFALPILNELSDDPYGIFAVVLTATRELAMQIAEQFTAFGAPIDLRIALVIGGNSIVDQSLALSRQPHVVIATPGRLRHHMTSADPPNLRMCRYLVLDEADRLLSSGFESDLEVIFNGLPSRRNTLLFSATLTSSIEKLKNFTARDTLTFDLTSQNKVPESLMQQYLFVPSQVKICYLMAVLQRLLQLDSRQLKSAAGEEVAEGRALRDEIEEALSGKRSRSGKKTRKAADSKSKETGEVSLKESVEAPSSKKGDALYSLKHSSLIIFTSSCKRCQEIAEVITQMKIDCVKLHAIMTQQERTRALEKFKSQVCNILVATDVASRGLDIPQVGLVINFDLPKISADYVHRVGRTARAGRAGRSLSLITPNDIELLHSIEEYTGVKLTASTEVVEDNVLPLLNAVAKARKLAQMHLMESGFEERYEEIRQRKRKQRKQELRTRAKHVEDA